MSIRLLSKFILLFCFIPAFAQQQFNESQTKNLVADLASKSTIVGVQQQTYTYAVDTGAANAYAVAPSPTPALVAGTKLAFLAANANTGASTLTVGGTTKAITKSGTTALSGSEIVANQIIYVTYDGTQWQLLGGSGASSSGITQLTGDVLAGPGSGSQTATLKTISGVAGTYINPTITVDTNGRVTSAISAGTPQASNFLQVNQASGLSTLSSGAYTPIAGKPLVIGVFLSSGDFPNVTGISDTAGNTWVSLGSYSNFSGIRLWICYNPSGTTTTINVALSASSGSVAMVSLIQYSSVYAQDGGIAGGSHNIAATQVITGSITTSNANDLLLTFGGVLASNAACSTPSPANTDGTGYNTAPGSPASCFGSQLVATTGSYTGTVNLNTTVNGPSAVVVALKTTGGAGGTNVISFNTRTGAVTPQTGDYTFAQISGTIASTQFPTVVSAGSCSNCSATIDAYGRVTSFVSGSGGTGAGSTCGAYAFCEALTVASLGNSTDLSGFAVEVVGTPATQTSANGGFATSSSGYDVGYFALANCTSKLNWEVENYSASSGASSIYWVLPNVTLSHTSPTVIGYRCVGNSAVTTDQSNAAAVWSSSNYVAVYHFSNTTNVVTDSTGNHNGTNYGSITATSGKIGNAASLNGSQYIDIGSLGIGNANTVEAWANANSTAQTNFGRIFSGGTSGQEEMLMHNTSACGGCFYEQGTSSVAALGPSSPSLGTWYYLAGTYDGALHFYQNGALSATSGSFTFTSSTDYVIGGVPGGGSWQPLLDEVRISSVARSADWIAAEYKMMNNPTAFYSVSAVAAATSTFPAVAFVAPPTSTTWINQNTVGSATATSQINGALTIQCAAHSGVNDHGLVVNTITPPYTFTIAMNATVPATNFSNHGIMISDGTKTIMYGIEYATGWDITVAEHTNTSTYSSSPYVSAKNTATPFNPFGLIWLQVYDDGTNMHFKYSFDGANGDFIELYSQAHAVWLTATKIGVGCDSEENLADSMTVYSWVGPS